MKIKSNVLGIVMVVVLFGGILVSSAMNMWKTESSKIPVTYTEGAYKGQYNPEDIRGSYSFGEVSELFNVPLEDLANAFNIPDEIEPSEFKNKDLESLYENLEFEVGNSSVKLFVALYRGLPYELEEDTYLLENAAQILVNKASLSEEQLEYLNSHTITIDQEFYEKNDTDVKQEEHVEENGKVTGKATFKDILDWGVSPEEIEGIIGSKLPNPVMGIRDYCVDNGLSFSTIKSALQEEVDKIKK